MNHDTDAVLRDDSLPAIRGRGVPPLPDAPEDPDIHWMLQARQQAILSEDPLYRSGCIAVRHYPAPRLILGACDGPPGAVLGSMARRRSPHLRRRLILSAEQSLVATAAFHGVSLQGASCYVWPLVTDATSVAALIHAGCAHLVVPAFDVPARMESDLQLIRTMAAEGGMLLSFLDPPPLADRFDAHSDSHGLQAPDSRHGDPMAARQAY